MKRIEKLIEPAITAATITDIVNSRGEVNEKYKGYVASFGAGIVQSGLWPTVIFFETEDSGAEEKREKVPAAIYKILLKKREEIQPKDCPSLQAYVRLQRNSNADQTALLRDVTDAAIALKIALRTFKFVK